MSNGRPVVIKLLTELLADTRSWHSHNRDVLRLAIDTLGVQYDELRAKEEVISQLRSQVAHYKESWAKLNPGETE